MNEYLLAYLIGAALTYLATYVFIIESGRRNHDLTINILLAVTMVSLLCGAVWFILVIGLVFVAFEGASRNFDRTVGSFIVMHKRAEVKK